MKVYLDNCCFNRPFDDQTQLRIQLESEAKLKIQSDIQNNSLDLIWSYMMDYENSANPFEERRIRISEWKSLSSVVILANEQILGDARELIALGLKKKDSLHIACAIAGNADIFFTTDDQILRKAMHINKLQAYNPVDYILKNKSND